MISDARRADPSALADLHARCFPHVPWRAESFAKLCAHSTTRLYEVTGGFLLARVIPPEAEILTLCVDPSTRRHGKARALVQALTRDAEQVFLEVAADNHAALALYRAAGFVETGRRAGYYRRATGAPQDAVTMHWALTLR